MRATIATGQPAAKAHLEVSCTVGRQLHEVLDYQGRYDNGDPQANTPVQQKGWLARVRLLACQPLADFFTGSLV